LDSIAHAFDFFAERLQPLSPAFALVDPAPLRAILLGQYRFYHLEPLVLPVDL
jgi:hypothetical protein